MKARDGPLVLVNHYCTQGPNAIFIALGEIWCRIVMSLEKCRVVGDKGLVAHGEGVGWGGGYLAKGH